MNFSKIPVYSILLSGAHQGISAFDVMAGIRNYCHSRDWDGSAWISPCDWVLEDDATDGGFHLRYAGSNTQTPPETARNFYAFHEFSDPAVSQRLAFCRLCFWVLSSGLAPVEMMPNGNLDASRLIDLKKIVDDLGANNSQRSTWAPQLMGLLKEELQQIETLKCCHPSDELQPVLESIESLQVSPLPASLGPNTSNDPPPESANRGDSSDLGEVGVAILAIEQFSPAHGGLQEGSGKDLEMRDQDLPLPVYSDAKEIPEWWSSLSKRSNPYTSLRIPRNARGGVAIEALDVLRQLGLDKFAEAKLVFRGLQPGFLDDPAGFNFNVIDGVLTGIPQVPGGDYELIFDIQPPQGLDVPCLRQLIPITINPDPQSLWRTFEPPDDSQFRKQHRDGGYENADGKVVVWASVRGRSHAHEGGHRDDDCRTENLPGGWRMLAVADGAGSAKFARLGSAVAVDTCVQSLTRQFKKSDVTELLDLAAQQLASQEATERSNGGRGWEVLVQAAFESQRAVLDKAKELGVEERTLGTTLLLCIARDVGDKSIMAAFSVGDGIVASLEGPTGRLRQLSIPDSGDFAGQTRFLTDREIFLPNSKPYSRLRVAAIDRPGILVAMTDGVSDPKFTSEESMADPMCWRKLISELGIPLREMEKGLGANRSEILQQWLDFWAVGHHDDRTIALCMDSDFLNVYGPD